MVKSCANRKASRSSCRVLAASICSAAFALVLLANTSCTSLGAATIGGTLQRQSHEIAFEIEQSGMLVEDPELVAYVRKVGDRLVEQVDASPVSEFSFAVLDDDAPNAFAIPSGHIYITRGLLILMGSEDELAGVLGHEIGHVIKQHSLKQATGQIAYAPIRVVTRISGALVGFVLPRVGSAVATTGELPAALTGASYGRRQENEADDVGQRLAARAGWDPESLALVMDALGREQELVGQDPSETSWFATHPAAPDRAEKIRTRAIGLSIGVSRPIAGSRSAFLTKLEGTVVGPSARQGVFNGSEFLHPKMGFVLDFPDGEGWARINTEQAVAVVQEDPPGAVVLQIVAEGDDALAVANDFEPRKGRFDVSPRAETVNDLQTAYATGRDGGGWGGRPAVRASARWIAHDGFVYRIWSESTEEGYAYYADDFDATERSFRVLTPADRERVLEKRLAIATAIEGETMAALLDRIGSDWEPAEAAVANAVALDATFARGDQVKVTRRVQYSSRD